MHWRVGIGLTGVIDTVASTRFRQDRSSQSHGGITRRFDCLVKE